MEPMDYHYITDIEKKQFLHQAVVETLMKRRVQLLKLISVAYNSNYIKELDEISAFVNALMRYNYTEETFTTQTLDGITFKGVNIEQYYGKTLKPNSEENYVSRQKG